MSKRIKTITIYASASSRISPVYFEAAGNLGKLFAEHAITCINGGGINGLMAAVTENTLKNGGNVCGVIPQFMCDKGWLHPAIQEVIITPDMHTRKRTMADRSDACIALPGGVGTFEELLEIITWKQLELYKKPIVILNTAGYYNPLLEMLDKANRENFILSQSPVWEVAATPEEALNLIFNQSQLETESLAYTAI